MKNRSFPKILLVIILITISFIYLRLFTGVNYKKSIPAVLGFTDLSKEEIGDDIIALEGQWEFYPDQIKNTDFSPENIVEVPKSWTSYKVHDENIKLFGKATYRLRIKVPRKGMYALSVGRIFSAYKLIVNNEEIIENGKVGDSYEDEISSWQSRFAPFYADKEEVEIILQVSNYHNNKGGIVNAILIGNFNAINNDKILNNIKNVLVIGVFAGIGFYLVLIYKLENKKYTYLFLGLFCISSLILQSILDDSVIYYIFKNISFNTISKLEYVAYIGILIALQLLLKSTYPRECNKLNYITNGVNYMYLALIIVTNKDTFGHSDVFYMIVMLLNITSAVNTLIKAIMKKRKFAGLFFCGIVFMFFTTVIDILYVNSYANIYFTSSNCIIGFLFFLLCQVYMLSHEVIDAFESSNKAKDMEIAFLQAQIAPHFFFNTLNNIYFLLDESVPKARTLILDFCDFLRVKHKFDYRKKIFYSLKEEIELIESYVQIENTRLSDFVTLIIDIDEDYLLTPIPQLMIQPIVENSIKHGLSLDSITITIRAIRKEENLEILISDNGCGMEKDTIDKILNEEGLSSGVGLKNVNFRLGKCYNTQLKIFSEIFKGTTVSFEIPLKQEI